MSTDSTEQPQVTVVIPSMNQARYLDAALQSVFAQPLRVEVVLCDGGSTDGSLAIIQRWAPRLAWWRSAKDGGQAAAVNEGMEHARAPYVCWLNSDDLFLPDGLAELVRALDANPSAPMVYGRCINIDASGSKIGTYWTTRFTEWTFARRCSIAQPATLIRRAVWEQVGGLDNALHYVLDYDLWWRIYLQAGAPRYVPAMAAANRIHLETKTSSQRKRHYSEAIAMIRRHYGRVPLKWYLYWPWAVWTRSAIHRLKTRQAH